MMFPVTPLRDLRVLLDEPSTQNTVPCPPPDDMEFDLDFFLAMDGEE